MESDEHDPELDPIPEIFHSFETGAPFTHCIMCKSELLRRDKEYAIQKSYFAGEVVIELAICNDCNDESRMSEESARRLAAFMGNPTGRTADLYQKPQVLEPWIARCLTCDRERSKLNEYTLLAICDGPDILYWNTPFMLCGACVTKMQECLSESTRDMWNDWVQNHLDCPPEMKKLIEEGGPILV